MIVKNEYPICEYDTSRISIIKPADFLEKTLPSKCVITFFRKELNQFVEDKKLPIVGYLHSEVLDIPIYEYRTSTKRICITMPFSTAEYSNAIVHAFQKFKAPFSGKIVHIFPEQSAVI